MEEFFKIQQRGSSIRNEVIGGVTTFLAMAYIVAVNPAILSDAGIPFNAALTATCFGAAIMTILMGVIANRPIALASGMGINAVVAYGMCGAMGIDWRVAMAVVMLEGVVILGLVLGGLRKAVMDAIPLDLRQAIGIGIGLFITFIGLKGAGLVIADDSTLLSLGSLTDPTAIVALISLACAIILTLMSVPGALLISIIVAVIVGIPLGVTTIPTQWTLGLDFSAFAAPFQPVDGTLAIVQVILQPALWLFVFSLLMSDFFDTLGTAVAVAKEGEFIDENGNVEDIQKILTVDSTAAIVGGFMGASSITCFLESASGVAAGARTGLSNIVCGALFIVCAFLAPLFGMVSGAATCGALVVVGFLIMSEVGSINWGNAEIAFPAFLTIVGIPFTYSITNGIGLGFISYVLLMAARGKASEVKPLMWVSAAAFLCMFLFL
jgi:AGZA family xanthine/uracil permease-like MFS transporter